MDPNKNIEEAIENGYSLRIGRYIERGFELFKVSPGYFIGFSIVSFMINMGVSMIPLLGMVGMLFIGPALQVGVPIVCRRIDRNESFEFGHFFDGFKKAQQLALAYLMIAVACAIFIVPLFLIFGLSSFFSDYMMAEPPSLAMLGLLFLIIMLLFFIMISFRWTFYLIVFHDYTSIEAIKTSWKLVTKNWFAHLGFVFMAALIGLVGMIALGVGIFIALPIIFAADYAGYADVTGLNESNTDEIEEIGNESFIV